MTKLERLVEKLKAAPSEVIDRVMDFVELADRTNTSTPAPSKEGIYRHVGALKGCKAFEGDPVEIQRAMRDEWR